MSICDNDRDIILNGSSYIKLQVFHPPVGVIELLVAHYVNIFSSDDRVICLYLIMTLACLFVKICGEVRGVFLSDYNVIVVL